MDKYTKISNSKKSQIKNLVFSNCSFYHKQSHLPPIPYFLESQSQSSPLLQTILEDSNYDPAKFSKKAADLLLHYNQLDISHTLKYLKNQQEAKEIQDFLSTFSRNTEERSTAEFKLLKTRSSVGPVVALIVYGEKEYLVNSTQNLKLEIELDQAAQVKIIVRDGDQVRVLEDFQVFFKEISKEPVVDLKKNEIEREIEKKSPEFEAKIAVCVRVCCEEKVRILVKRLRELEKAMEEENQAGGVYNDLIEKLQIVHDAENGRFRTCVPQVRANGRNCCATCRIV